MRGGVSGGRELPPGRWEQVYSPASLQEGRCGPGCPLGSARDPACGTSGSSTSQLPSAVRSCSPGFARWAVVPLPSQRSQGPFSHRLSTGSLPPRQPDSLCLAPSLLHHTERAMSGVGDASESWVDSGEGARLSSLALMVMGRFPGHPGLLRAKQGFESSWSGHGAGSLCPCGILLPRPASLIPRPSCDVTGRPCPPAAPKVDSALGWEPPQPWEAGASGRCPGSGCRTLGSSLPACPGPPSSLPASPGLPDGPDDVRGGPLRGQRAPHLPGEHAGHQGHRGVPQVGGPEVSAGRAR